MYFIHATIELILAYFPDGDKTQYLHIIDYTTHSHVSKFDRQY